MGKGTTNFKLEETLFWKGTINLVRVIMVCCSIAVTCIIAYGCFLRYVLHTDFYGIDDIILLFAFWLYFMGAVHGSYENSHIKADILMATMRNLRLKDAISLAGQIVLVIVNVVLIVWAVMYFVQGVVEMPKTTALKIPYFIPRFGILLGLILMEFYHIYHLVKNFKKFQANGFFSEPNQYDYLPDKILEKHPGAAMSKAEADALKEANKEEVDK